MLLAPDRTHLFIAAPAANGCDQIADLDLTSHGQRVVSDDANLVALAPDGSKAVVQWNGGCATSAGKPAGQMAMRDLTNGTDTTLSEISGRGHVNGAWDPDGAHFAAEPAGTHHVVVYDAAGSAVGQVDHLPSSQDGLGWTSDGLILVDLGVDRTAVLRTYDPGTARSVRVLARVPEVAADGKQGALVTPQVRAIHEAGGRTFVETAGGTGAGYAQLLDIEDGNAVVVVGGWQGREFVG